MVCVLLPHLVQCTVVAQFDSATCIVVVHPAQIHDQQLVPPILFCSPLQLVLSERYSSLSLYNGWDYSDFVTLAHIPIRSVDNFHTLASALSQGTGQVNGEATLVNLLAAVRSVSGCGGSGAACTESGCVWLCTRTCSTWCVNTVTHNVYSKRHTNVRVQCRLILHL